MKKYILLLLLLFTVPVFSQVDTWYNVSKKEIPYKHDALVYLDGTIINISGSYYFRDISGNNRHFLINNYDFPTGWKRGFPYKSASTISAPLGDATLIAADLNNFWYSSGGTPNQIPVVSLREDIDFEHKNFTKHQAQILNENGSEFYEPRVLEIVLYNTVKTGAQLAACQSYFNVPTEQTSNVRWCSKAGNDSPNTGTKLSPWLTQTKVNSGSTNGDMSYTKTGLYKEATYLGASKLIDFHAIGFNTIQSVSTGYVVLAQTDGLTKFSNWIIDGELNTASVLYLNKNSSVANSCYVKNPKTNVLLINGNGVLVNNCVFVGSKGFSIANALHMNTCYADSCTFSILSTCDTISVINSRILYDKAGSAHVTAGYDIPTTFLGNNITVNNATNWFVSNIANINSNFVFNYNKVTGLNFSTIGLVQINKSFQNITATGNTINLTTGQAFCLTNTRNSTITNNLITSIAELPINIYNNEATIVGNHTITGNKLFSKYNDGYIIHLGSETTTAGDNTIQSIIINNNYLRGNKYYSPTSNVTCHGYFIGFSSCNSIVKHNWVEYVGMNVLKGSNSDYSNCHVFGNVIRHNKYYGQTFKGVDNAKVTNNTFIENGDFELFFLENTGSDGANNDTVLNNIVINTTGLLVNILTTSCANNTIDYNVYYSTVAKPFSINGVTKTWSEWQSLGYDTHSIFLTTEQFNNLFTNYAAGDYSLKAGSLAIGAGTSISSPYNVGLSSSTNWGNDTQLPIIVTKTNSTNDIGAYIH